jgi:Fic family protein
LLIPVLLCSTGILQEPMLYLSLYFKQHRDDYYAHLDRVRKEGDWEAWLEFFMDGVRETAEGAVSTARRLIALFQDDRERIQGHGRMAGSALRVHQALKERPITSLQDVCNRTGLSFPAATSGMKLMEKLKIIRELTGKQRNRMFGYDQYLTILSEGTEPI